MKTWEEMIKELRENPEKEFISKGVAIFAELKAYHLIDEYGEKTIRIINNETKEPVKRLHIDRKWEEVKEPVGFMEAVNSGKKIKSAYVPSNTNYLYLGDYLNYLSECYCGDEIRDILNGKFYIED